MMYLTDPYSAYPGSQYGPHPHAHPDYAPNPYKCDYSPKPGSDYPHHPRACAYDGSMGPGYHMGPSPYGCGYDDLSAIARMTPYSMACKAKNGRAKGNTVNNSYTV